MRDEGWLWLVDEFTPIALEHVRENRIQSKTESCGGETVCAAWGVDRQIPWGLVAFCTQVRASSSSLRLSIVFLKRYNIIDHFLELDKTVCNGAQYLYSFHTVAFERLGLGGNYISVALVRKWTITTERPPLLGEVSFFFFIVNGVRLSPLGSAATTGVLYQPQMIDDGDCGEIGGMKIGRGNRSTRRKPARTWASAVGIQRLTAWAMARPVGEDSANYRG
jgi:hypothetical protein